MKKIALIACYFGPFPLWFPFWMKTCAANPSLDFLIYTDQPEPENVPGNMSFRKTTLAAVRKLAAEKLDFPALSLERPYKLCDYKPLYGLIFQDDLTAYDFWGHLDVDLFLGNISRFVSDEMLEKYDKLYPLGHLSIYRNTEECSRRFFLDGAKYDWRDVLSIDKNFCFDEWPGIYAIYRQHQFSLYDKIDFADVSWLSRRFSLRARSSAEYARPAKDYPHQLFFWDRGELRRAYLKNGEVLYDDFLYLHFLRRKLYAMQGLSTKTADAFFITPSGLFPKAPGAEVSPEQIKKYNPYYGKLYEYIEMKIRRKLMKRKNHQTFAGREYRLSSQK